MLTHTCGILQGTLSFPCNLDDFFVFVLIHGFCMMVRGLSFIMALIFGIVASWLDCVVCAKCSGGCNLFVFLTCLLIIYLSLFSKKKKMLTILCNAHV